MDARETKNWATGKIGGGMAIKLYLGTFASILATAFAADLTRPACAQMSPDEAQRLLREADKNFEPTKVSPQEPSKKKFAKTFEELPALTRATLREWAEYCVSIDGDIWCSESLSAKDRVLPRFRRMLTKDDYIEVEGTKHSGWVDPYTQRDSRAWVRLANRISAPNDDGIDRFILERAMAGIPGATLRTGKVIQILNNGLLLDTRGETWFLITDSSDYIENVVITNIVKRTGRHQYTSVMGSQRTIGRYELVDLGISLERNAVTPHMLFDYLRLHAIESLPVYRPRLKTLKGATYKSRKVGAGPNMARMIRTKSEGATYVWEWVLVERPLRLEVVSP